MYILFRICRDCGKTIERLVYNSYEELKAEHPHAFIRKNIRYEQVDIGTCSDCL